jgi:hypothetical protein
MKHLWSTLPISATLALALAACGGGGTPGGSSGAAPNIDQSQVPAPSQAAAEAPASAAASNPAAESAPPAGAGPAGDVCALATEDELGRILGKAVKSAVIAGPPDTCDIQSTDGAPLAAFVLTKMEGLSASTVYEAYASAPGATAIPGIGEKAAFDPNQGTLVILRNGAVLSIAVFDDGSGSLDDAARLEFMKQIGVLAAGRM